VLSARWLSGTYHHHLQAEPLKTEAVRSFETLVTTYKITLHDSPEYHDPHLRRLENLKSQKVNVVFNVCRHISYLQDSGVKCNR
jgi:hypothetical protein